MSKAMSEQVPFLYKFCDMELLKVSFHLTRPDCVGNKILSHDLATCTLPFLYTFKSHPIMCFVKSKYEKNSYLFIINISLSFTEASSIC